MKQLLQSKPLAIVYKSRDFATAALYITEAPNQKFHSRLANKSKIS